MNNITEENTNKMDLLQCNLYQSALFRYLFILALMFMVTCSSNQNITGTSSGTEAKFAKGTVYNEDGSAAVSARVWLIPADYNPVSDEPLPDSAYTLTDTIGKYKLLATDTGVYNIQAVLDRSGSRLSIQGVHIIDTTITVGASTLSSPGTIKIFLPDYADTASGYLYLPGTCIAVSLKGKSGTVLIDSIPANLLTSVCYTTKNTSSPTVLRNNVLVRSYDTTILAMPGWKYSSQLFLNTTASGTTISNNVLNFPLLVRLNTKNFIFNQAMTDGNDIRFTKNNGTPLTFEIEKWDTVSKEAVLWVNVDTIYGNDSTHHITMYWGNPVATRESNSPGVFDTTAGFQGVWHLSENEGTLHDATGNGYNGTRKGNQTRNSGISGYCQYLDGSGDFTEMGNVCNPAKSDFTFCGWIKKSVLGKRQTIASKSAGGSASLSYGWLIELDPDGALFFYMATAAGSWGSSGTFTLASNIWITDTSWHHVAIVINRSEENKSRMYIDGADVSTLPTASVAAIGNVVNTLPLRLGADTNGGNPWTGSLDECSISSSIRSQEWVRLSYINQKIDNQLISFR